MYIVLFSCVLQGITLNLYAKMRTPALTALQFAQRPIVIEHRPSCFCLALEHLWKGPMKLYQHKKICAQLRMFFLQ